MSVCVCVCMVTSKIQFIGIVISLMALANNRNFSISMLYSFNFVFGGNYSISLTDALAFPFILKTIKYNGIARSLNTWIENSNVGSALCKYGTHTVCYKHLVASVKYLKIAFQFHFGFFVFFFLLSTFINRSILQLDLPYGYTNRPIDSWMRDNKIQKSKIGVLYACVFICLGGAKQSKSERNFFFRLCERSLSVFLRRTNKWNTRKHNEGWKRKKRKPIVINGVHAKRVDDGCHH